MKRFALIGVGGYVAPKHLKAIKEVGGELVACLDPKDSVGILDNYFPNASFFTEFERFDRHLEKLARKGDGVDYISICSPNYLHDAHVRFALRLGANAICEKPLVIEPWNIDALIQISMEYEKDINIIHQLRLHPEIQKLKQHIKEIDSPLDVTLHYCAPRGIWYKYSWKGDPIKSGGMVTNIGIHLFDLLIYVFGPRHKLNVMTNEEDIATGTLKLEYANVDWQLSTRGKAMRILQVENEFIDLSTALDLHTLSYQKILKGEGWSPEDVEEATYIVHDIRNSK